MTNTTVWIVLAALALAGAWFFLTPTPEPTAFIEFEAHDPWIIGSTDDAFAYAGEDVRAIEGIATLQIDPDTDNGVIEFALQPSDFLAVLLGDGSPDRPIVLRMQLKQADAIWTDTDIYGDSAIGDSRLPMTHILYAGSGTFELLIDGNAQPAAWVGFWSIGDALRQPDGSIRNQGLVFSPLLRDQSVFSDPSRTEITLLIYDAPESDTVVLHLVFASIHDDGS